MNDIKVTEVRLPQLLGVGSGSADSNAPRDGEVLLQDEQPTTALRPHASALWLQPARLSRPLAAFLSSETAGTVANASSMSSATATPIDVWTAMCAKYKAGKIGELAALLGVKKVVSLSHLSRLLAPHVQPLPPPAVIPQSALTPTAASSPMLATMQLLTVNNSAAAAAAGQAVPAGDKPNPTLNYSAHPSHTAAAHPPPAPPASDIPTNRRGFMAAMKLSVPLARLLGHHYLSRPSVVRHLWTYIRTHKLQRESERRIIDCNTALAEIMGSRSVTSDYNTLGTPPPRLSLRCQPTDSTRLCHLCMCCADCSMFEMNTFLTQHLTIVKDTDSDWIAANKEAQEVEDRDREEDERTGKKKKGESASSAKKRAKQEASKVSRRSDKDDSRGKGSSRSRDKDRDKTREKDRDRSRSKRDRGRDRDERRKKHKKRRRESDDGHRAAEGDDTSGDDGPGAGQPAVAADVGGKEREETADDESDATDDDDAGAGVGANGDLSTHSEASSDSGSSSGSGDEDEDANGEDDAATSQGDEEAADDNSMLSPSRSGQVDDSDDDDDTGQSGDEMEEDEDDEDNGGSAVQ